MRVITLDNDTFGVEAVVKRTHQKVPPHWYQIFPAWYVIIFDHTKTFRWVDQLQPIIKEYEYNAKCFSRMAEHRDDWWSVRMILQPPTADKFLWALWIRHADDTMELQYGMLSNMADILWCSFPSLREVWIALCKREFKDIDGDHADTRPRNMFCGSFSELVYDRRRFRAQNYRMASMIESLEKQILAGAISFELKRPF